MPLSVEPPEHNSNLAKICNESNRKLHLGYNSFWQKEAFLNIPAPGQFKSQTSLSYKSLISVKL